MAPTIPASSIRGRVRVAGLEAGLGHEDVARPGSQEVGDVEATAAALEARDALLQEDPLDQLSLREV